MATDSSWVDVLGTDLMNAILDRLNDVTHLQTLLQTCAPTCLEWNAKVKEMVDSMPLVVSQTVVQDIKGEVIGGNDIRAFCKGDTAARYFPYTCTKLVMEYEQASVYVWQENSGRVVVPAAKIVFGLHGGFSVGNSNAESHVALKRCRYHDSEDKEHLYRYSLGSKRNALVSCQLPGKTLDVVHNCSDIELPSSRICEFNQRTLNFHWGSQPPNTRCQLSLVSTNCWPAWEQPHVTGKQRQEKTLLRDFVRKYYGNTLVGNKFCFTLTDADAKRAADLRLGDWYQTMHLGDNASGILFYHNVTQQM